MSNNKKYLMSEPINIGRVTIKNRIVFPPMNTNLTSPEGYVTPELEEYYVRRARGGAGLIVLEAATIDENSRNHPGQPAIYDRKHVAGWARLTEKLHRYDAKVSVELVHYGSEASIPPRESPSAVSKYKDEPGDVLTKERIGQIQRQFAYSAGLAKKAGMDMITLHACHGYLIAEFLSPVFNHRTDEYGGSFENRCRFLLETIDLCRKEVGPAFPILVRYSANEFIRGGRDMDECVKLANVLEEHGVDAIDISAGQPSAYLMTTPPYCLPQAECLLAPYSAAIKKAVKVPVFTAIGIRYPEQIEEILASGQADLICLGRPQIADPDFYNKAVSGNGCSIRKCLSCEHCLDTLDDDRPIACAVNPECGREIEFDGIEKSDTKNKVVVVGAGPAGMEAARCAALRGHDVTIIDRNSRMGGSLIAAAIPPHKGYIGKLVDWYSNELKRLNVEIQLGIEADEESINKMSPDVLFLAAGAHYIHRIPGSDLPNVIDAVSALRDPDKVGEKIVIVGGGATGTESADFFAGDTVKVGIDAAESLGGELLFDVEKTGIKCEKQISIVEMIDRIGADLDVFCRDLVMKTLDEKGVGMYPGCRVEEITPDGVRIFSIKEEKEIFLPADTVILAGGLKPNCADDFKDISYEVIRVGDAIKAGKIKDALYTAYIKAREI